MYLPFCRKNSNLRCYYQNVRGLNAKVTELYNAVSTYEFDVIELSESEAFLVTGLVRRGGVLLALRVSLNAVSLNVDRSSSIQKFGRLSGPRAFQLGVSLIMSVSSSVVISFQSPRDIFS